MKGLHQVYAKGEAYLQPFLGGIHSPVGMDVVCCSRQPAVLQSLKADSCSPGLGENASPPSMIQLPVQVSFLRKGSKGRRHHLDLQLRLQNVFDDLSCSSSHFICGFCFMEQLFVRKVETILCTC